MADEKDREEALFQVAIDLETTQERADYLTKECGQDGQLRHSVEGLIRAHQQAGGFLEKPASGVALNAALRTRKMATSELTGRALTPAERPGDRIGNYKLLQKIGEGGCGVVYMAEQEAPVRRRVALKIIKAGMDTRQVIARFEAERQALAMMDHPNIARVLDAGATDTGRPFFVMDLVRGIRITDYCDQSNLPTNERLDLFSQVCHAIQHAHQKGIIHRDIKPSNILVTLHDGVPVPVIIDFGIAKATEQRLTDKTLFTAYQQFMGTPAYMSPEQAEMSNLDVDTRSDIYSLGVLLYELLTGRTPFDPKTLLEAGLDAMRRTIREQEPPRPSTRLSTMLATDLTEVARHRHAEPLRLISSLRGDLDWIVMKCLEKDRTRRYETANGLAMDIQRHLHNEPVLARPPSRLYRFQKMVRRNKVVFVAAAIVAAALLFGLGLSSYLFLLQRAAYRRAVLAERNQARLRQEAETARASDAWQRHQAEEKGRESRLNSYAADIYGAWLAARSANFGRTADLLDHQLPKPGELDLRGFEWRYLWQLTQGDELISLPHPALVSCATFCPNGRQLITASYDGFVRIWDLNTRQVVQSFDGFDQQFGWRYVACSPDGQWLAGVRRGHLTVWALSQPGCPFRYEEKSSVQVLAFTPDSLHLIGWGDSGLVILDTAAWQSVTLPTQLRGGQFLALAISPDGDRVALAHERKFAVEVWNLNARTQESFRRYERRGDMAFVSLAWGSSDLIAASTWSGSLLLIDAQTGKELASAPAAHTGTILGLAFTPDARTLLTAGHDQLIHLWSVPNLNLLGSLHGHRDEIWSLAFSSDGRSICTAGKDGTAKIWSPTSKPPPVYLTNIHTAQFTADSKLYVALPEPIADLTLNFWDVENPEVLTSRTLPVLDRSSISAVVLSKDARMLGVRKADSTIEVWSTETGKMQQTRPATEAIVTAMAFSSNGRGLVLATQMGTVETWNLKTDQGATLGRSVEGAITAVSYSAGNQYIQAETDHGRVLIWDARTGELLALPLETNQRFRISPDGTTLAVTGSNYVVQVWEVPALKHRFTLQGHRWAINTLAFSPDGRILATGGSDAVARLWDVTTGAELTRPLRGHLQGVTDLAFSPDGNLLVTGSTDNTVRFWHVATGRELFSQAPASDPAFSPDGNTLLLDSARGRQLFHVPPLAQIDEARKAALAER